MVPMWMFPVAIACGNTFVLKPSERDPSAPAAGRSCSRRPACPTACSTSCTATRKRSTRCSTTPTSQAVSFVGSTPIAEYIYARHAHGKRVQALGGAKNHMVVMPDADLDQAPTR
jgi:malonate-semialdehyde dehydrogenase (acetylating) / methylmalonate-semialdehyde dehydrogenase